MNPELIPPTPDLTEWDAKMRQRRVEDELPKTSMQENELPKTFMQQWLHRQAPVVTERTGPVGRDTRPWREAAQNPDATAGTLTEIWDKAWRLWVSIQRNDAGVVLVMEAVASHPNTPPEVLWDLPPVCARALCANPIAPLILLERPDFVQHLSDEMGRAIVREEAAPRAIIAAIASGQTKKASEGTWKGMHDRVEEQARFHIALAGEIQTQDEWEADLSTYCKQLCQECQSEADKLDTQWHLHQGVDTDYLHFRMENAKLIAQWHCDLAELGLAPPWMREPSLWVEPRTAEVESAVGKWLRFDAAPGSPEEQALWAEITRYLKDAPALAKHLRQNATPSDLIVIVKKLCRIRFGKVRDMDKYNPNFKLLQTVAAHPNADGTVLQFITSLIRESYPRETSLCKLIIGNPHAPAEYLELVVQDGDPELRRLARRNPNAPAYACNLSRAAAPMFIRFHKNPSFLMSLLEPMYGASDRAEIVLSGQAYEFASRLRSALVLSDKPTPLNHDPANRTCRDLLQHLARDGNRLVQWAAQKRLAEPAWTFDFGKMEG